MILLRIRSFPICFVFSVLFLLLLAIEGLWILAVEGRWEITAMMAACVGMFLAHLFFQTVAMRTRMPLLVFVPALFFAVSSLQKPCWKMIITAGVIALGLLNAIPHYDGLRASYMIKQENISRMRQAAVAVRNGEMPDEIHLRKFDLRYAESDIWGEDYFQVFWLRAYYGIPDDMDIIYED